ncbi:MAG: histidine phosphatase family protein, partial [Candidatus Dormibacteraceae bacterium]
MITMVRPELREIGLGEWQGKTREEVRQEYPLLWERWQREIFWDLPPGGEGAAAFRLRVAMAVREWMTQYPVGDVLYVTHGGVIQAVLRDVVEGSLTEYFPFQIDNCSLTVLERTARGLVITAVNEINGKAV